LEVGSTADICIYDPKEVWNFTEDNIQSEGVNSPFLGWEFEGRVTHTLFEGRLVYSLNS